MPISSDKVHEIIATVYAAYDDPDDALREVYYRLALQASQALDGIPRDPSYWRAIDQSFRLLAYSFHFRGLLGIPGVRVGIALGSTMAERWFSLMDIWIELLEFVHDHYNQMLGLWPLDASRQDAAESLRALHEARTELASRYLQKNLFILPYDVLAFARTFTDAIVRSLLGEEQGNRFNEEFDPLLSHVRLFQRDMEHMDEHVH